ncbi:MAG: lysophospholipid acyltransferase family protein [Hyphomicrobiaceae bacterium]
MALADSDGRFSDVMDCPPWRCPGVREIMRHPLPGLGRLLDRTIARTAAALMLHRFAAVRGIEHISSDRDPFVLAFNHASRLEAVALPALLMYHRGGRRVHFLADWNFQMIPGIGLLYRRSGAIVVMRKSARPRFLNALKPLYAPSEPSHERALAHLEAGRSIGIFPEGTVNRDPARLMRGRYGAARLSLESGAPIVPAGIRLISGERRPMLDVTFGAPIRPPAKLSAAPVAAREVRAWHATMMTEIARLSGKSWEPLPQEPRHGTP